MPNDEDTARKSILNTVGVLSAEVLHTPSVRQKRVCHMYDICNIYS